MIYLILLFLFGAFVNSCLSFFLDFCFSEGNIFEKWRPFIAKQLLKDKYSEAELEFKSRDEITDLAADKTFWYKPLGGCVFCMNTWLGFISFWLVKLMFGLSFGYWIPAWYLAFLIISHLFLKMMNKLEE